MNDYQQSTQHEGSCGDDGAMGSSGDDVAMGSKGGADEEWRRESVRILTLARNYIRSLQQRHDDDQEELSRMREKCAHLEVINVELISKLASLECDGTSSPSSSRNVNGSSVVKQVASPCQNNVAFYLNYEKAIDKASSGCPPDVLVSHIYSDLSAKTMLTIASAASYFYKQGQVNNKSWKRRLHVLVDNFLFLYRNEDERKPLGVLGLPLATSLEMQESEAKGRKYLLRIHGSRAFMMGTGDDW